MPQSDLENVSFKSTFRNLIDLGSICFHSILLFFYIQHLVVGCHRHFSCDLHTCTSLAMHYMCIGQKARDEKIKSDK